MNAPVFGALELEAKSVAKADDKPFFSRWQKARVLYKVRK
jgi:hypothetical protein